MLDMLDFKAIADEYCEVYRNMSFNSTKVYMCVWALLIPNSVVPNATKEELQNISEFLKKEGYYAKVGGRPKSIGTPMPDKRRPV
jgi:hypothetical protein